MEVNQHSNYNFLTGGGEMSKIIRNTDWNKTSLGPIETWPASLCTTLGIILHSAFPKFLFWGEDLLCFYNDAYKPSLGINGKHPAIGKKGKEVWADIWDFVGPILEQVMRTGKPTSFFDQLVPIHRDGKVEEVYWSFCYSAAFGNDGNICGMLVTCTETTETVLNKAKLEESDRRLRSLILQAPVAIGIFRGENYITEIANTLALELWGRKEEEVLNKSIFEAMPELVSQGVKKVFDHIYTTGEVYTAPELPLMMMRDGKLETIYINFRYEPLFTTHGEIDGIMAAGIDVTEQVISRQKIEDNENRLRTMVDNIPNLAWMAHPDGWIYWYNQKWYQYTGTTPTQMEGWGWQMVHDPEVLPEVMAAWNHSIKHGFNFEMTFPLKGADGIFRQFLTRIVPVYNDQGVLVQWFGTNTDVTEHVETQKMLEESEKKFRLLADSMPQYIWTSGPEGNLNYYNQSVYDYTGLAKDQIDQEGWIKMMHPEDQEKFRKSWMEAVNTGENFLIEHRFRRHDGEYRWQLSRAKPQRDEFGNIKMWVGTSTDIQEQKSFAEALEKEVRERTRELAQNVTDLAKMNKELQSFAYISSHDLQEPLRKIQTFSSRIVSTEKDKLSEKGQYLFTRMQSSAERMQSLIDDLLTYSRTNTSELVFEEADLIEVIDEVKDDLKEEIDQKKAVVSVQPIQNLNIIYFQFQQLFHNLFSNSLKFSRPETPVLITITSECDKGINFKNPHLEPDTNYCHISFSDNGIGFEPQYNEKIFDLFQRLHAKNEYIGTGIGLSIVKKIVENHNGVITANGKPDEGATFDIYLPV
ncbi:MAG: PAS domain S-box protein [Marinoscillum sp.]